MYEYFESLLKTRGITAYRVSKDTGIRRSCFSDWKSGRCKPKSDKMLILAKYFDVPVENFITTEV